MNQIQKIHKKLHKKYGNLGWWPIKGRYTGGPKSKAEEFEVMVGAILTQNTSWKNVEKAISNLHKENLIDAKKIAEIPQKKLAKLIKSAGYYNQKAERLKIFADYLLKNPNFLKKETAELRKELLSIKGIGPETADSILLYALNKPIFVVDAYTKRIFSRIGICKEDASYDELQQMFHKNLPKNTKLFNNYHAVLVEHAKNNCRKKPECNSCVLSEICSLS
jgi:endonuclease-3 related protein